MEVIAKTNDGYLISASEAEVMAITRASQGSCPEKIANGHKLPAFDYASIITKARSINDNYNYRQMLDRFEKFQDELAYLKKTIDAASDI